jgi:hypothetical protein
LTDCTATVSQAAQDMAIAHDFPMFSYPVTHDAFVHELAGIVV